MSGKLTLAQGAVLVGLAEKGPSSAYRIRATLQTMHALERRKLVRAEYGPVAFKWPQSGITWHLTATGKDWLATLPPAPTP